MNFQPRSSTDGLFGSRYKRNCSLTALAVLSLETLFGEFAARIKCFFLKKRKDRRISQFGGLELETNVIHLRKISLPRIVTPAKAGVQNCLQRLDSGLRRNDAQGIPHHGEKA